MLVINWIAAFASQGNVHLETELSTVLDLLWVYYFSWAVIA